jgi:acetylglutamate kinase
MSTTVIKLGGAALKESLSDARLYEAVATARAAGSLPRLVVVHGGGPEINKLAEKLGLKSEFIDGQRVTSPEFMEVVEMVLRGKVNPALVRGFLRKGLVALGLTGVDLGLFECAPEDARLGRVGHVKRVLVSALEPLLKNAVVPVVAPIGVFKEGPAAGETCNVNADLAASRLAVDLKADRLLFLTDKDGILDSGGAVIRSLSLASLKDLYSSSTVSGGMKVKVRAILEVLEANPSCKVEVMNGLDPAVLSAALLGKSTGTAIG